jgi:hypothetical protein
MSLRRAQLSDDLVGRMMYVKENLEFLGKHYRELRKKETVKELHHLVNLKFNYLIAMDEDDEDIVVGKTIIFWISNLHVLMAFSFLSL